MYNRKMKIYFLRRVPRAELLLSQSRYPPESAPVALYPQRVMKQPTSYVLGLELQTAMLGDISAIVLEKYYLVGK